MPGDYDPQRLRPDQLASDGHYLALAALASNYSDLAVASALGRAAHDPQALRWLWALVASAPDSLLWVAWRDVPPGLEVPADLQEQVRQLLLEPGPQTARATARDLAREAIFMALAPDSAFARAVAAEVLGEPRCSDQMRLQAAAALGTSRDPADRQALREAVESCPRADLAEQLLQRLAPRYTDDEQAWLLTWLQQRVPTLDPRIGATVFDAVRQLLAHLDPRSYAAWLGEFTGMQPASLQALLTPAFLAMAGLERVRELARLAPDLTPLIAGALQQMSEPQRTEFGEWAHSHLDPELLAPLRTQLTQDVQRTTGYAELDQRRHTAALAALRRFALACPPDPDATGGVDAARDYAQVLAPGQVQEIDAGRLEDCQLRQLGRVLGLLLQRGGEEGPERRNEFGDDARVLLQPLLGEARAAVLRPLARAAALPLPAALFDLALEDEASTRALLAEGGGGDLAQHVHGNPAAALRLLELADPQDLIGVADRLAGTVDWTALASDPDSLARAVSAVAKHRSPLAALARRHAATLRGPAAATSPARVVSALLSAMLDAGIVVAAGQDEDQQLLEAVVDSAEPGCMSLRRAGSPRVRLRTSG